MAFDIIGDIHGHADTLEVLLRKLGYSSKFGIYQHPEQRKVAFVGDFIDRGPKIRETLHIVRNMVDSGNAIAVMGNHEFNAISFHTPHIEKGGFFRDHTYKEIRQHLGTLEQFKYFDHEWADFLEWFKTLPLFFENDVFRLVHACWDNQQIAFLRENYKGVTPAFLSESNDKQRGSELYHAVNDSLKGKEDHLPDGHSFFDKDGTERSECRIKWWQPVTNRTTLKDVMLGCPTALQNKDIHAGRAYHAYHDTKPVFFGHYWLQGEPHIDNHHAICLDYSVAKGGILVACRLGEKDGELAKRFFTQRAV
jgi:hypothetical protein